MVTPLVDTHVHVVSRDVRRYPRQPADPTARWFVDHACPIEAFLALMDAHGVARSVVVQALGAYGDDNRYCLDAADAAPERLAPVVYVDAASGAAPDGLAHLAAMGARGVRIVAGVRRNAPGFGAPEVAALWDRAATLGLRVVATTLAPGLPSVVEHLIAHPATPVAIDHCGFPDLHGGPSFPHARALFDLAALPNVHVKVTTNVLDLATAAEVRPGRIVDALAGAFGPERLQWGSDWSHTNDRPYAALAALARDAFGAHAAAATAAATAFWFDDAGADPTQPA